MNAIVWNCRGLGSAAAVRALREVIRSHSPHIVGLIETKRKNKDWEYLRTQLGFINCFVIDRVGFSGGMALLWKDEIDLVIRNFSRWHIDAEVKGCSGFRFTVFYGNPVKSLRKHSWSLLSDLSRNWRGPWMVAGDFNEVRFDWEASGRGRRNRSGMIQFNDTIAKCGLVDLGYSGSIYTFTNKQKGPRESRARLDRALGNMEMKTLAPKMVIHHVLGLRSDHSPLIINFSGNSQNRRPKPFSFEFMWHRHPEFGEIVRKNWKEATDKNLRISDALSLCANHFSSWNRTTFEHVQKKIRDLKSELSSLQGQPRSECVAALEEKLSEDLDEWLAREEYLWRQRSRIDCLREGDSNTPFFHARASHRKALNRIEKLVDAGSELRDSREIRARIESYFSDIFKSRGREVDHGDWIGIIPSAVSVEAREVMAQPFTREDIKSALFQLAPDKAPGIDGYPALFFQRNWATVGDKLYNEVLSFMNGG